MSKTKTYRVSYYIEAGYFVEVSARSPAHAAQLVRARLDEERDTLEGSERVHYDDGVCQIAHVRRKRSNGSEHCKSPIA